VEGVAANGVPTSAFAASIMVVRGSDGLWYRLVHQLPCTSEVKHGHANVIDHRCGVVVTRRWGLGILSLALVSAGRWPASRGRKFRVVMCLAKGSQVSIFWGVDKIAA
jgi:hypothetical protein